MKHTASILLDHKSFGRTPSDRDLREILGKQLGEDIINRAKFESKPQDYKDRMYEHSASVHFYDEETIKELVIIIEGMQVIAKVSGDVYSYDLTLKLLNLLNK